MLIYVNYKTKGKKKKERKIANICRKQLLRTEVCVKFKEKFVGSD